MTPNNTLHRRSRIRGLASQAGPRVSMSVRLLKDRLTKAIERVPCYNIDY
jgi:hypothetical protein